VDLTPRPEHRFTFGLWTVGNPGRDPFGEPTRPPLDPVASVERLAELGAEVYVFWGGREGTESAASKRAGDALERYREAIDFLCGYVGDQGYGIRFAIEPKPNEPRGDIFLPTVGHALHFISTLEHPEMVGVNPEVAHETIAGLSFVHSVSQALWAGKLFHIDLNSQRVGRYDQDFRFGAEDLKEAFLLVHLLETSGYDGFRHFDAHAYRSEDPEGVWDFASGCMRTYLALAAKSREFTASEKIRAVREAARIDELAVPSVGSYSREAALALLAEDHDLDALAGHGYSNERLDQLVVELLLGSGLG
jgi:xylose isomerase